VNMWEVRVSVFIVSGSGRIVSAIEDRDGLSGTEFVGEESRVSVVDEEKGDVEVDSSWLVDVVSVGQGSGVELRDEDSSASVWSCRDQILRAIRDSEKGRLDA